MSQINCNQLSVLPRNILITFNNQIIAKKEKRDRLAERKITSLLFYNL